MTLDHPPGSGGDSRTDRVDQLVTAYVDRLIDGETLDFDEILIAHSDIGDEIVRHLRSFVELGEDPDHERPLGTLGDYTLRRQIGRGGMGVVYEAWQGSLERQVALKVLPAGGALVGSKQSYRKPGRRLASHGIQWAVRGARGSNPRLRG